LALNNIDLSGTTNVMTWQANGRVGINNTAPDAPLVVQGATGTGALKLIAPSVNSGDNWWLGFGHGTTSTDANDRARIGVDVMGGGAGRLFFTTGPTGSQTRAMFIDESQRVGIGNSAPANRLEITQGTTGNSGLRFTNLNSSSTATTTSSKVLGLNSSGDVILTNLPGTQNIVDFSTATPTTDGVVFTPDTPVNESVLYQSAVDNSMWTYNGTTYVTYTPPASTAWYTAGTTNDAGSSKTSSIYRTGNVGIGTNSPLSTLHVQHPLAATASINANSSVLRLSRPTTQSIKNGNVAQFNLGSYTNGGAAASRLDLALNDGGDLTTLNTVMTMQANGNVGIGTTSPTSRLVVRGTNLQPSALGTAATNATLRIDGDTNHALDFGTYTNVPYGAYIQSHNKLSTSTLPLVLNPMGGNVGIGIANPLYALHVIGDINASGAVRSNTTSLTSDARLKSNVVGINNGLSKIMALRPVNYDKKFDLDSAAAVNEHGFIAQELQKIMPELVTEGKDEDKLLSINYTAIIPVLTKAIQEQQVLIEANQTTIQKQQEQIDELKALLMKLLNDK
jgi:hypothetical protein